MHAPLHAPAALAFRHVEDGGVEHAHGARRRSPRTKINCDRQQLPTNDSHLCPPLLLNLVTSSAPGPPSCLLQAVGMRKQVFKLPDRPEFLFEEEAAIRRRGWGENLQFYTGLGYITGDEQGRRSGHLGPAGMHLYSVHEGSGAAQGCAQCAVPTFPWALTFPAMHPDQLSTNGLLLACQ